MCEFSPEPSTGATTTVSLLLLDTVAAVMPGGLRVGGLRPGVGWVGERASVKVRMGRLSGPVAAVMTWGEGGWVGGAEGGAHSMQSIARAGRPAARQ